MMFSHQVAPYQLHTRPTKITVDLDALSHNLSQIRLRCPGKKVLASVKADGYGHGMSTVCQHLEKCGIDYLGIAFVEEGVLLRQAGVKTPILIFGGLSDTQIDMMLEHNLEITAASVDKLHAIDACAAKRGVRARVHLKIDTGMERIGTHYYSAQPLLEESLRTNNVDITGIYSHFATADDIDISFASTQLKRFKEVLEFYSKRDLTPPLVHMANSGGVIQMPESHFDMVRPGIILYGAYPEPHLRGSLDLKPVMSVTSRVVYFKVVKKGAVVSYGSTWKAPVDTRIVTVPIGYGDGFSRANSNSGSVLIRGKKYPIVGRVCMDQIMVNIGPDGEAYNGDEVVLLGGQGNVTLTAEDIATSTNTIAHEVLSALTWRIPRVYTGGEL